MGVSGNIVKAGIRTCAASASTEPGPDSGNDHSHPAVVIVDLDHAPHNTAIRGLGARGLGTGSYSSSGRCFLIWKSVHEIHQRLEGESTAARKVRDVASMRQVLVQIALLEIVFSLDSVITAVGMATKW